MTKNDPKDTVVGQPSGPGHAIMARLDLDAHGVPRDRGEVGDEKNALGRKKWGSEVVEGLKVCDSLSLWMYFDWNDV